MNRDIFCLMELSSGGITKGSLELLRPGRDLAAEYGARLTALILGADAEKAAIQAAEHGADRVIAVEHPLLEEYSTENFTSALCGAITQYAPLALLIPASPNGKDLAPRAAARLGLGLTADCTGVEADRESGLIGWITPAYGGSLMAVNLCRTVPQMGTVRPGMFKLPTRQEGKRAELIRVQPPLSSPGNSPAVLSRTAQSVQTVDLTGADVIVTAGRGVGGPEGVKLAERLAQTLGAALGATRAVTDMGWLGHDRLVGQTGQAVAPRLYIALGVSGASQHLVGIGNAETVVAVNRDPSAPIFAAADLGIVGDLFQVVPELIREIEQRKK